jgi:hypothetical protein
MPSEQSAGYLGPRMGLVTLLATTLDRDDLIVAAEESEHRVHVIGLRPSRRIATFDTIIDFGGSRLALCAPGSDPVVVAGAWERHGAAAYDGTTGTKLWQRRDLKRVQRLSPAAAGGIVAVGLEGRAMHLLDVATGDTVVKLRAAAKLWQSRFSDVAVTNDHDDVTVYESNTWRRIGRAQVPGFAALSASFGPDSMLVGSTAGVTCLDLAASLRWQRQSPALVMYNPVAWDEKATQWIGLEYHANREIPESIVRWSDRGLVVGRMSIEGASDRRSKFLPGGELLITSQGALIDTRTGRRSVAFTSL